MRLSLRSVPSCGFAPDVLDAMVCRPILPVSAVRDRLSLSRSHLYELIARGLFPPLAVLGPSTRGLSEVLLDAWFWARLGARDVMGSLHDPVVLPAWRPEDVRVPPLSALRMLRLRDVEARVLRKRTAIYRDIAAGVFPAPAPLTCAARRWPAHEVEAWRLARLTASIRVARSRADPVAVLPRPPHRPLARRRLEVS